MKKARYDGPSGTGVDVLISLPDGQQRYVHVDQGHQLPTEMADGTTIPASERDKLLKSDEWTEVEAATPKQIDKPAAAPTKEG